MNSQNSYFCSQCLRVSERMKLCSRCKRAWYCNEDCQKQNWPAHKSICTSAEAVQVPNAWLDTSKPRILLLSLLKEEWLEELHSEVFSAMRAKASIAEALDVRTAQAYLSLPDIFAVLVTDGSLAKRKRAPLRERLAAYTKSGGRVVLGLQFSNSISLSDVNNLFLEMWGLPWKDGSYHRTTFTRTPAAVAQFGPSALLESYSMKALHLKDVHKDHAMYYPTEASRVESAVFGGRKIDDHNETPMAYAKIDNGFVGYVGDVNGEKGSIKAILAMLGFSA